MGRNASPMHTSLQGQQEIILIFGSKKTRLLSLFVLKGLLFSCFTVACK